MRERTSAGCFTMLNPSTIASPESGEMSVASIRSVVVLPAPLGPSRPKISPLYAVNESPSTAVSTFLSVCCSFCCL